MHNLERMVIIMHFGRPTNLTDENGFGKRNWILIAQELINTELQIIRELDGQLPHSKDDSRTGTKHTWLVFSHRKQCIGANIPNRY